MRMHEQVCLTIYIYIYKDFQIHWKCFFFAMKCVSDEIENIRPS